MAHYTVLAIICAGLLFALYCLLTDNCRYGLKSKLNRGARVYFKYMGGRYYGASIYVNRDGLVKVVEEKDGRVFFMPMSDIVIAADQNPQK